jgi:hypothetical protein
MSNLSGNKINLYKRDLLEKIKTSALGGGVIYSGVEPHLHRYLEGLAVSCGGGGNRFAALYRLRN